MKLTTPILFALAALLAALPALLHAADASGLEKEKGPPPAERPAEKPAVKGPAAEYDTRTVEGWTVHVNRRLLATDKADTDKMLDLLAGQLANIVKVVPAPAVEELRKVHLWVNPEYPGVPPTGEYHPEATWLRDHGRNPAMARGIEFTDVRSFEREAKRMPMVVLHELSHAYHDRVLGFDQPDVIACYKRAKESGTYDKVDRFHGPGLPITRERAYAMTNEREYFAECSEAFFGRNDFFPFTRDELEKHDPQMFKLLEQLWQGPPAEKAKDSPVNPPVNS